MKEGPRPEHELTRAAVVKVDGATIGYSEDAPILRDVSLTVRAGDVIGIAGSTGVGKSTLLYALCGIIPRYVPGFVSGDIELLGENATSETLPTLMADVGFVFQDPESQLFNLLVRDELVWGLENRGLPPAVMQQRLEATVGFLEMKDLVQRITYDLSGGEKQRVALAAAHITRPRLFLMDDPTSQLDPVGSNALLEGIRSLADHGQTIVLVEQKLDALLTVVDRLIVLGEGRVLFDGSTEQIVDEPEVFERAGMKPPELLSVRSRLLKRGMPVPRSLDVDDWAKQNSVTEHLAATAAVQATEDPEESDDAADQPAITVTKLTFRYPPPRDVPVLTDVDLTVPAGAVVALLGRNGSGKTTLARCLSGHLQAKEGVIEVGGRRVADMPMRERTAAVGYVFQNPRNQVFKDPVIEDVAFGPRNLGWPEEEIAARSHAMLERMGLLDKADLHPYELSKGDLQRLAIAGVLIMEPDVLIVDEPTTGQDPNRAIELTEELCELTVRRGRTLVIITHAMDLVTRFADTTVVMQDGEVAFTGSSSALFASDNAVLQDLHLSPPPVYELTKRWGWPSPALTVDEALRVIDAAPFGRSAAP